MDATGPNEKILQSVLAFINQPETEITLISVIKNKIAAAYPYVSRSLPETAMQEIKSSTNKLLDDGAETLRQAANESVEINTIITEGDPAGEILRYAKDHAIDVIVIGSRGLDGVKGLMLGSVSHKVSQLSNCPVLIVH